MYQLETTDYMRIVNDLINWGVRTTQTLQGQDSGRDAAVKALSEILLDYDPDVADIVSMLAYVAEEGTV